MNSNDKNIKIAIIGGDLRQIYTAIKIADRGYEVNVFGFEKYEGDIGLCKKITVFDEAIRQCCALILPIPVSSDGKEIFMPYSNEKIKVSDVFDKTNADVLIVGGKSGQLFGKYERKTVDYFEREELVTANAYLTAESAVSLAMQHLNESIHGMNILVMGYGRIGKSLCHLLKSMGANVFASARKKSDFAWIRSFGYSPVDTSKVCDVVSSCKLIFNTIPTLVLGENVLYCLPKDCLIIDLASKPGGVDFNAANKCGLKTLWALGLPGKMLPESAGAAQASVILDILEEEGII